MATIAIAGRKTYLRFSTSSTATTSQTLIAELQSIEFNVETAQINVTSHDSSGWEENLDGIRNYSVEATANYISTGGQGAFRQSLIDGDVTRYFTIQMTTATNAKLFKGQARNLRFSGSGPTDGQAVGTFSFRGHGAIVRTA